MNGVAIERSDNNYELRFSLRIDGFLYKAIVQFDASVIRARPSNNFFSESADFNRLRINIGDGMKFTLRSVSFIRIIRRRRRSIDGSRQFRADGDP